MIINTKSNIFYLLLLLMLEFYTYKNILYTYLIEIKNIFNYMWTTNQ